MLGASGAIPGAIAPEAIPAAAERLRQKLDVHVEPRVDEGEDREPQIALATRAGPLLDVMRRAGDANVALVWEQV